MEITGKIIEVLPIKSGTNARGSWELQSYVLETEEQNPQKLLFDVFGSNRIKEFNLTNGNKYTVTFAVDARETNGRWYGSARAYKVTPA